MWLCSPPRSPLPPDPQTVVVSIHRTPQTYGTTSPPFLALADTPPLCATALLLVVSAKISYKRMEDLPGSFKGTAENPYQNVSILSTKPASSPLKALCILDPVWSGRRAILRMCDFPRKGWVPQAVCVKTGDRENKHGRNVTVNTLVHCDYEGYVNR